jgi:predicted amidohydrolase YtcJ
MAALGAHASVNPYYIHALADDYAKLGLGEERASQITRTGDMLRQGLRVSFHSDFMMAPTEPLFLAWCAATRITTSGKVASPTEQLSLVQALRGITIDAAWALKLDHEIGSIVAGKRADFCVLAEDPFELGADGLKDLRVAGTVFEGNVRMLDVPIASLHTKPHTTKPNGIKLGGLLGAWSKRYKPVATRCCGAYGDTCDLGRQWASYVPR